MRQKILLVLACLLLLMARAIAQEECSEFVQTALATTEQECVGVGRNQACFGNNALTAVAQPDASNFQFSGVGDITDVAAIQSMQLSGYDPENGIWGLVMMQVQADIPNTIPGQNVTVLLFGDVTVQNAASSVIEQVPPEQEQTIQATSNVNVRALPNSSSSVIGTIAPNVSITATGRSEDSQWIRVRFGEETGWIFAQLLDSEFDPSNLFVVTNPDVPLYSPMQAFYLTTGIGRPSCAQVPDDGMLVQTPEGVASINLFVNEISVEMGSTVYFSINDDGDMEIEPIEGSARIETDGETEDETDDESTTVVEGGSVTVPLNEEFLPDGPPSDPETYFGDEDIDDLPIDVLEREIEPDEGLTDEELQDLEDLQPVLDYVDVEDADDLFDYAAYSEDGDIVEYLIEEGYTDFGGELEDYFEEDLGYDLGNYDDYAGDDVYNYDENYVDSDGDGIEDSRDDYVDADNDGVEDSQDGLIDGDGDGIDDRLSGVDADGDGVDDGLDDYIDSDGDGIDDRYEYDPNEGGGMVDADGDGIDDSYDDFVDSDGDGVPDDPNGTTDGGTADGGTTDGGTSDGGTSDGGTTDGGTSDGGSSDGGSSDGGSSDGGTSDGSSTGE